MTTTLNNYTREEYTVINRKLRNFNSHPMVEQVLADLKEVKTFEGVVYRGLTLNRYDIPEVFEVGRIYRDMGFMSCSRLEVIANKFNCLGVPVSKTEERSITLIIESKTGKDVSSVSQYPEEAEVLFAPLTSFEVVSVEKDDWQKYTVVLKEV